MKISAVILALAVSGIKAAPPTPITHSYTAVPDPTAVIPKHGKQGVLQTFTDDNCSAKPSKQIYLAADPGMVKAGATADQIGFRGFLAGTKSARFIDTGDLQVWDFKWDGRHRENPPVDTCIRGANIRVATA